MHVTIKDIAAEVGVHHSTVSRALEGHPHIAESTREKVVAAAERLGYRKNPLLSALASYRKDAKPGGGSTTLAYITNWPQNQKPRRDWGQRAYFNAAQERALTLGYKLEEFSMAELGGPARLSSLLQARGIPGVIFHDSPYTQANDFQDFDFDAFACVAIGYSLEAPMLMRVMHAPALSMRDALMRIAEIGYQKPFLILDAWQNVRVGHQWQDSFLANCPRCGLDGRLLLLEKQDKVEDRLAELLSGFVPDIILSYASHHFGMYIRPYYASHSLTLPKLAILNRGATGTYYSGINQKLDVIGRKAVDSVISQIMRRERGAISEPILMQVVGAWEDA